MVNYWLVKSESDVYPITQLKRDKVTQWTSVRNYQARNFLREMKVGDLVLYYHSNSKPSGIVGLAQVTKEAYPDPEQFDRSSEYYDPKASKDAPRWFAPDLKFLEAFSSILPLEYLKREQKLSQMMLFHNSRLSVQKVTKAEFHVISALSATRNS